MTDRGFQEIVDFVIDELEGGDKIVYDNGGLTRYGISSKAHPNVDVANLTREDAVEIYRRQYWVATGCDTLTWPIRLYVFDAAVNQGPTYARQLKTEWKIWDTPDRMVLLRVARYHQTANDPDKEQDFHGWIGRVLKVWHLGQLD